MEISDSEIKIDPKNELKEKIDKYISEYNKDLAPGEDGFEKLKLLYNNLGSALILFMEENLILGIEKNEENISNKPSSLSKTQHGLLIPFEEFQLIEDYFFEYLITQFSVIYSFAKNIFDRCLTIYNSASDPAIKENVKESIQNIGSLLFRYAVYITKLKKKASFPSSTKTETLDFDTQISYFLNRIAELNKPLIDESNRLIKEQGKSFFESGYEAIHEKAIMLQLQYLNMEHLNEGALGVLDLRFANLTGTKINTISSNIKLFGAIIDSTTIKIYAAETIAQAFSASKLIVDSEGYSCPDDLGEDIIREKILNKKLAAEVTRLTQQNLALSNELSALKSKLGNTEEPPQKKQKIGKEIPQTDYDKFLISNTQSTTPQSSSSPSNTTSSIDSTITQQTIINEGNTSDNSVFSFTQIEKRQ